MLTVFCYEKAGHLLNNLFLIYFVSLQIFLKNCLNCRFISISITKFDITSSGCNYLQCILYSAVRFTVEYSATCTQHFHSLGSCGLDKYRRYTFRYTLDNAEKKSAKIIFKNPGKYPIP